MRTLAVASFDAPLEREALDAVGDALTALFEPDTSRQRLALIVASDNAGTATSVRFWADAQRTGVAMASPELFPWCLANAPCGALARRFGITGPNLTLLGEGDALQTAFDSAADLFAQGTVDAVLIVAIAFAQGRRPGVASAWRVDDVRAVDGLRAVVDGTESLRHAIEVTAAAIRSP